MLPFESNHSRIHREWRYRLAVETSPHCCSWLGPTPVTDLSPSIVTVSITISPVPLGTSRSENVAFAPFADTNGRIGDVCYLMKKWLLQRRLPRLLLKRPWAHNGCWSLSPEQPCTTFQFCFVLAGIVMAACNG